MFYSVSPGIILGMSVIIPHKHQQNATVTNIEMIHWNKTLDLFAFWGTNNFFWLQDNGINPAQTSDLMFLMVNYHLVNLLLHITLVHHITTKQGIRLYIFMFQ